jgi:glycosyltransferase involved in cell wall biosynthesis
MKKKKILFNSNFSKFSTGFGRHARAILTRLFKTGKYEIIEYSAGPLLYSDNRCKSVPWKCYGALPDSQKERETVARNELEARLISYGHYYIDKIVNEHKPDVAIFVEDIWGVNGYWDKNWFNKINSIVWTPVDSLPVHPILEASAGKIKNLWVKADFAKKALHDMGHTHVQTWPAIIDQDPFFPLDEESRNYYRKLFKLDDCFVIGFVFRNQLRKLVGSLFDGFKKFKEEQLKINPNFKAKVLLHTFWDESEGWNIPQLIKQVGLSNEDVVTTYICRNCHKITVNHYAGQNLECVSCGAKNSVSNPSVDYGLTEGELNVIYNVMDYYCHPMTSGGFEIPMLEASLAGVPLGTCPYACGEIYTENKNVYPFDISFYRERNSNFWKSQPSIESIAKSMTHFYEMGRDKRKEIGQGMREWAISNFNPDTEVKKLEEFIDSLPEADHDFNSTPNPEYPFVDIENNIDFIKSLYNNILKIDMPEDNEEFQNIIKNINNGVSHESVYNEFIKHAKHLLQANEKTDFKSLFDDNGNKRLLYIMPKSLGDCYMSLAVLDSIKKTYNEGWDIYVATEPRYFEVFAHLDYVKNIIAYDKWMDEYGPLEGIGSNKGVVDVAFKPYLITQYMLSHIHNGLDIDTLQIEETNV